MTTPAEAKVKAMWLLAPAMGVRAAHYQPFVDALAAQGIAVGVVIARGRERGDRPASPASDIGMREVVTRDWPPAIAALRRASDAPLSVPLSLAGHSFGALLSLVYTAQHPGSVAGIVTVGAGMPNPRDYDMAPRLGMGLLARIGPPLTRALGYFPGDRLGFGGRQPRSIFLDWIRQMRTGRLPLTPAESLALREWRGPLHAIRFVDDPWAPRGAVEALTAQAPSAAVVRTAMFPSEIGLDPVGHFGWLRRPERVAIRAIAWAGRAANHPGEVG